MTEKKPFALSERLFDFASRMLDICSRLPSNPEASNIRYQLSRSGTSGAANWEESEGAVSKKDKIKSMIVARKEIRESRLWLRLISGRYVSPEDIENDIKESTELLNILSTIIKKLS